MIKKDIVGILRAGEYSPNHINNDAMIFNAVAECLRQKDFNVTVMQEDEFLQSSYIRESVIVNMCRRHESILALQGLERDGRVVVNSAFGIENCTREKMTRILIENNVPYPKSIIVNTDDADVADRLQQAGIERCWVKRGDFHAMHKEDVSFCRHPEETSELLKEYSLRGIKRAVINIHLEGDLIKFYGVRDTPFFYWFYPLEAGHSKFGQEEINGKARGLKFDLDALKAQCNKAAHALNVVVYGGDCIISESGEMQIIDFNDWPSFAPCRNEAAPCIADAIINEINKKEL